MKTKILFICTGNRDRGPTAKALCVQYPNLEARAAGTSKYAITPLTEVMVRETDVLAVMEQGHAEHIREHYAEAAEGKPLHCLDIPDEFQSMEPALVRLLQERLKPILEAYHIKITGENTDRAHGRQ